MENTYQSVLDAAHKLDVHGRMMLLEALYGELHQDETLSAQLDEAERRLADYRSGKAKSFPAQNVIQEARERIRR